MSTRLPPPRPGARSGAAPPPKPTETSYDDVNGDEAAGQPGGSRMEPPRRPSPAMGRTPPPRPAVGARPGDGSDSPVPSAPRSNPPARPKITQDDLEGSAAPPARPPPTAPPGAPPGSNTPGRTPPPPRKAVGADDSELGGSSGRVAPPRPAAGGSTKLPPPRPGAGGAIETPSSAEKKVPPARPGPGASAMGANVSPPALPRRPSSGALIASEKRASQRLSARLTAGDEDQIEDSAEPSEPVAAAPPPPRAAVASPITQPNTASRVPPPRPGSREPSKMQTDSPAINRPPLKQSNDSNGTVPPPKPVSRAFDAPKVTTEAPRKPASRIPQQDDFDDGVITEGGFLFKEDLPFIKAHSGKKREYMSTYTTMGKATIIVERNAVWNPAT